MSDTYREFLEAKVKAAPSFGLPCSLNEVATHRLDGKPLRDHQRHVIRWGVEGGRRAYFLDFGLGKSTIQVETGRIILEKAAREAGDQCMGLIVGPLGCRSDMIADAAQLGVDLQFVRTMDDVWAGYHGRRDAGDLGPYICLTNFETVRDGKLDLAPFLWASIDEAAALRDYGSETFQTFLPLFDQVPYRHVATALPDPNRDKELIHYSAFLGIMDSGQALTRFFQRNSEKAGELTLYPHKEDEFWLWVSSWAVFLQKPSDLGFSDEGYDKPKLHLRWHKVEADLRATEVENNGQGRLIRDAAIGVVDASREKRRTLPARIAKLTEIVNSSPNDHFLLWHDLEDERAAIEAEFAEQKWEHWGLYRDGNPHALALYERHYSSREGRDSKQIVGPGAHTVLMTDAHDALFVWRKFIDDAKPKQTGINCAVFRNEGLARSSTLIREAMAIAWQRWPGERLYTYVNAAETTERRGKASRPGKCFIEAGWVPAGKTQGGLDILAVEPGVEVPTVQPHVDFAAVYGSQALEKNEALADAFARGEIARLAAKPSMLGSGRNFQYHCHRAIFAGVGFKFHDWLQALHRIWRFLQAREVEVDLIYAETEAEVRRVLEAKWERHQQKMQRMGEIIRKYGLQHEVALEALKRSIGVTRVVHGGEGWTAVNNDCVEECRQMETNSVDLIVTSIPFGNHYEYSASYNDFGHTDDHGHFFAQMDFLTPELLRILKPGRLACVHVKDRIRFASVTGMARPTVEPFHADTIAHFRKHGWGYMGLRFISTDVVRENNQTYRLTYKELRKDSSKMGCGSPEFLLLFFKLPTDLSNGYADEPVTKDADVYSLARWQIDADALWRSSGDRPMTAHELGLMQPDTLARMFPAWCIQDVYDHEAHVVVGETLEVRKALPKTFAALKPGSVRPDVWTDITRMHTLNGEQTRRGLENHICPLQFDIVDRCVRLYSNPGELVFDPFMGLGTVPMRALKLGRRGAGVELSPEIYRDAVHYCREAEAERATPSLLDLIGLDDAA